MAKSSFSSKSQQLTQKTVKNDQKLINISHSKMMSKLTTKMGDSGSAGLLERKCVIIGALNLVSKNDQK